jgi:hypothetical protein
MSKNHFLPQRKHNIFSIIKINWLLLFEEISAVYSENISKSYIHYLPKMQLLDDKAPGYRRDLKG